jgi:hypothetical protein
MHPRELAAVADQGLDVVQARIKGPRFPQRDESKRELAERIAIPRGLEMKDHIIVTGLREIP